jgi:hypothetical protein
MSVACHDATVILKHGSDKPKPTRPRHPPPPRPRSNFSPSLDACRLCRHLQSLHVSPPLSPFCPFRPFVFRPTAHSHHLFTTLAKQALLLIPYFYGRTAVVLPPSLNCSHENDDHRTSEPRRFGKIRAPDTPSLLINTFFSPRKLSGQQGVATHSAPPQRFQPFRSLRPRTAFKNLFAIHLFAKPSSLRCSALSAFSAVKSRPIPNPALSFSNIFRPFSPVPNTF